MANLSYLLGVESRAVFPGLGKGRNVNHVVVACAKWKVPLLWFALFSPKDMVQLSSSVVKRLAKQAGEEPYDFELRAPIIARENVTDRLSEARDILNATLPKIKTWDSHLTLLGKSIGRLPKRYTYVTCQWDEIVAMQPKPFYAAAEWLLKFFAGARLRN